MAMANDFFVQAQLTLAAYASPPSNKNSGQTTTSTYYRSGKRGLPPIASAPINLIILGIIIHISCAWSQEDQQPRYRLAFGKGTSVCEDYLKHLNAFPPDEPAMICERKIHPNLTEFKSPEWEEIDIFKHLEWVYEIDYQLHFPHHKNENFYGYTSVGKKAMDFDTWRKDYEARTRAVGIEPHLYRAILPLEEWSTAIPGAFPPSTPLPPLVRKPRVWLAYDKGFDRCTDWNKENIALESGGIYNIFVLNEARDEIDFKAFLFSISQSKSDVFVHREKTYLTHAAITDLENKTATLFISMALPTPGPDLSKYIQKNICRIEFDYNLAPKFTEMEFEHGN